MSNALTIRLASLLPARLGRNRTPQGIDLGGGRQLPPEDVLESHYKRLAAASSTKGVGSHEVRIQVGPNIKAAIRVMAPGLAPLADIAEEIATKLNTVEPEPNFRMELHRALEEAHRQMAAQRALQGDAGGWRTSSLLWYVLGSATATVVTLLALIAYWQLRRRSQ